MDLDEFHRVVLIAAMNVPVYRIKPPICLVYLSTLLQDFQPGSTCKSQKKLDKVCWDDITSLKDTIFISSYDNGWDLYCRKVGKFFKIDRGWHKVN